MNTWRLWALLLLLSPLVTKAEISVERIPNAELFGLKIGAGGEYFGRVASINSISLQNYRTAAFRVTEVVIDMTGSPLQLRIYHASPLTPEDVPETRLSDIPGARDAARRGTEAMRRASEEIPMNEWLLFKEYPVTTHAKTIEFTVAKRSDVLDLYQELKNRWVLRPPSSTDAQRDAGGGLNGVLLTVP